MVPQIELANWVITKMKFSNIFRKISKSILKSSLEDEELRKRHFLVYANVIAVLAIILFSIINIINGWIIETLVLFCFALLLILNIILLRFYSRGIVIYRINAVLALSLFSYEFAYGGGEGPMFLYFYAFPVVFFYLLEKKEGTKWIVFSFIVIMILFFAEARFGLKDYRTDTMIRFIITYLIVALFSYILESSRVRFYNGLLQEKIKLEKAIKEIKQLRGLIPICSSCKKIRDDKGYWNQIESYISEHSEAKFSHGICPECAKKLYPHLDVKLK